MPKVTLSAQFVSSAKCLSGKKTDYYDSAIKGFILEVRSTGGSTYYLRYRDPRGRQCQYKIGDASALPFEKARSTAKVIRARVTLGESPLEEKQALKQVPTLNEFNTERYLPYIKVYKKSWLGDECNLRNHILPAFGNKHLDEITQKEVFEFHHQMLAKGLAKATCNRLLILLRYMFNLAKKWKVAGSQENPTLGVPLYEANNARERFLSPEETQRLKAAIEDSANTQLKFIVPLLLLTGARKRELLDAKWEDIDAPRRNWRIPVSKSGKARHVPLSAAVLDLLEKLPRFPGCPYVVPNPETLEPFVNVFYSWNTARNKAMLPGVRMHDLRHSMASNLVNSGRSIYEVSKILGHSQLKTSERYAHLAHETLLAAADAASNDWCQRT